MHLADLVSHILALNLTALHTANDCEIPWEEDYRNREGALAAGKTAAAAEGGEFHLVVKARLPDLRRGLMLVTLCGRMAVMMEGEDGCHGSALGTAVTTI